MSELPYRMAEQSNKVAAEVVQIFFWPLTFFGSLCIYTFVCIFIYKKYINNNMKNFKNAIRNLSYGVY
jgi:hypothetical protein